MNDMKRLLLVAGVIMLSGPLMAEHHSGYSSGNHTNKTHFTDSIGFFQSGDGIYTSLFRGDSMTKRGDECARGTAIQVVPFGGRTSDHGSRELGRWFGLNHKDELTVAEKYDNGMLVNADIDASHFNIQTNDNTFRSTFSFRPRQTFFGVGLDWKQALVFNDDNSARWWAEISAPIVHVKNTMHLKEKDTTLGTPVVTSATAQGLDRSTTRPADMVAAFSQEGWKYGKIASWDGKHGHHKHEGKWGLADLELKLGYNSVLTDCATLSSYVGVVFPTGTKEKAEFVFEPVVGSKHFGIEWGSQLSFSIWNWDESNVSMKWDLNSRYMFSHKTLRSFDLVGKPWSRYMEMYENFAAVEAAAASADLYSGTSGINLMTRKVDVTPRLQINNNVAMVYEGCNFLAEAGWTFYARQDEKITPNWVTEGPVLKSQRGMGYMTKARTIRDPFTVSDEVLTATEGSITVWQDTSGTGFAPIPFEQWTDATTNVVNFVGRRDPANTNTLTTDTAEWMEAGGTVLTDGDYLERTFVLKVYGDLAPTQTNYDLVKITKEDVDWESGAHEAVLSSKLYGTLGYNWGDTCYPTIITVGGAYDFAYGNSAMQRWTVFGKLGMSF